MMRWKRGQIGAMLAMVGNNLDLNFSWKVSEIRQE